MNLMHLSQLRRSNVSMTQQGLDYPLGTLSDFELNPYEDWKLTHVLIEDNANSSIPALRVPTTQIERITREPKELIVSAAAQLSYGVCPDYKRLLQVCGYSLECDEHFVGVVEDFIIDVDNWTLKTLVVESFKNMSNKPFFYVPVHWVLSVDHKDQQLRLWLHENELERVFRGEEVQSNEEAIESYAYWQLHHSSSLKTTR